MESTVPDVYLHQFADPLGYMDFASTGPVSARVASAAAGAYAEMHEPGGSLVPRAIEHYEAGCGAISALLGRPREDVTIMPSTSAGIFQVAFGLEGGNVVLASHEFPANVYPWLRAEARGGPEARLVEVPDLRLTPDALAGAIDARTVAVSVSLVDYRCGFRCDVGALREAAGDALLMVDAIQGLGAVDFDAAAADVIVCGGQKWLRAGFGAGFMVAGPRARDRLEPTLTGWWGVTDFLDFITPPPHPPRPDADRFGLGSPSILGAVTVGAALEVMGLAGIEAIHKTIAERVGALLEVLHGAGADLLAPWRSEDERAGILTFRLPGEDPAATAERLRAAGLTFSERAGWLRLSPHATTSPEAVTMLAEAL